MTLPFLKPMIWCVDPGAVASGIANFNEYYHSWYQFEDPKALYEYFYAVSSRERDTLLIEDYSHGGTFTAEAKATLEVVGYIYHAALSDGYTVHRVHKDKRLSRQGEAAKLMGGTIATLKKDPERKDAFSALAHCIAYYRETS
jgi:hypothetical protein